MPPYYYLFFILIIACAIWGASVSAKVRSAFQAYGGMPNSSRMTGYDTAVRLLRANGVNDITVGRVRGTLSDHYHPTKKVVNLSDGVYGNASIAAVAVAAHEIGHVMQKKTGYGMYRLRTALVPITNIGSRLALPLVLLGLILDLFVSTSNASTGFYLALAGVALYGLSTLFALVTLPVELNASRRAKEMLLQQGILRQEEIPYADKMLDAAAKTYVASLLTSLVYFLRFLVWVMVLFGRTNDRRR
ncbi:MAG: zinc metallopeptidase [Clostridiales bacterium]|nr:zinc metallopeptidase [Clostridiales bacterium]